MRGHRNTLIVLSCVASITILESIALMKNVDGKVLSFAFLVIGGLGGFYLKNALAWFFPPQVKDHE